MQVEGCGNNLEIRYICVSRRVGELNQDAKD